VVDDWRRKAERRYLSAARFVERHDAAIARLADYLKDEDLYAIFPRRISSRKETDVGKRNDEFYGLYRKLIDAGETKRKAIQTAAEWCIYSEPRGYEIVRVREGSEKRERKNA
jgi:hypothetical protein